MSTYSARPLDDRAAATLRSALAECGAARLSERLGVAAITLTRAAAGLPLTIGNRALITGALERLQAGDAETAAATDTPSAREASR